MDPKYKNSYKVNKKELVSLSVYNVGFQKCEPLYQWGPGIRDHYLIHHILSGKGYYSVGGKVYALSTGDTLRPKSPIMQTKKTRGNMPG